MFEYRARILRIIDGDTVEAEIDLGFHHRDGNGDPCLPSMPASLLKLPRTVCPPRFAMPMAKLARARSTLCAGCLGTTWLGTNGHVAGVPLTGTEAMSAPCTCAACTSTCVALMPVHGCMSTQADLGGALAEAAQISKLVLSGNGIKCARYPSLMHRVFYLAVCLAVCLRVRMFAITKKCAVAACAFRFEHAHTCMSPRDSHKCNHTQAGRTLLQRGHAAHST